MNKRIKRFGSISIISSLLLVTPCLAAPESMFEKKPVFEITARVMSMDLVQDKAIVAEKEITLKSHIQKGQKVWDTKFLDIRGEPIAPGLFETRDRVRVTGIETKNGVVAEEIILMD